MQAGMMAFPLTLTHFLERARTLFAKNEVAWRRPDRSLGRYRYGDACARACRLAHALTRLGVGRGDRVATLMWNSGPHLEAYLAVPAMGAVLHTLNLRLHPSELGYIARHAEDKVVLVERSLVPLLEKFRAEVPSLAHVVVAGDGDGAGDEYEARLAAERDAFDWPALDENAAAMLCYTSGTTGNPKGVAYSHRSTVLHTLVQCTRDALAIGESDVVLPVVPMFHANAWGLPFAAALTGAKLVLPGPHLDAASLLSLMADEKVTFAAGVPTIWLGILAELDRDPKKYDLSRVRTMLIGGAAAPASMIDGFDKRHGLRVLHAWGMTEMNPLGTIARVKASLAGADDDTRLGLRASQGYEVPFVEMRHVGDDGALLPRDGIAMGELEVRGPWVAERYVSGEGQDRFTADGWFKTGDVVTICPDGYMRITDRSKDVVKSGGEWISSVALENALMAHPSVLEAAVFAARHPKWDERPVAAVVLRPGCAATKEELSAHLAPRFARFWLPDDYVFIAEIPRTSTGKFLKTRLRELYGGLLLEPSPA